MTTIKSDRPLRPLPADQPGHRGLWHGLQLAAQTTERTTTMTTLKLTARYARYLVSTIAAVAFGMFYN